MSAIPILTQAILLSALLNNALGAEPQVADRSERQLTAHQRGHAAMWPHWQPVARSD